MLDINKKINFEFVNIQKSIDVSVKLLLYIYGLKNSEIARIISLSLALSFYLSVDKKETDLVIVKFPYFIKMPLDRNAPT